jgi:hypothetical protein
MQMFRSLLAASGLGAVVPITGGFESSASVDHNSSSTTFSSQGIGTADAARRVVVAIHGSADNRSVSTVTIGGVSANGRAAILSASNAAEIWDAIVPTGTTGDIVVTWSGTQRVTGISVYAIYDAYATVYDTATSSANPSDLDLNVLEGGFAIATVTDVNSNTTTWVGLTEDFDDNNLPLSRSQSSASLLPTSDETSRNITATPSGTPSGYCGASVSYQPVPL